MVVATMAQLSAAASTATSRLFSRHDDPAASTLGILAFDLAKTMSRLISLYQSLTDRELAQLRWETLRSQGVTYLNVNKEGGVNYLLRLAGAERLETLESAAASISLLGRRCSDFGLNKFDIVYADLKLGWIDIGMFEYGSRNAVRIVEKMERLVSATASLYASLEALQEMETSEKKLQQWKKSAGPAQLQKADYGLFESKIAYQRKKVRRYKERSLWNQTYNKCVGLMARTVFVVFARICTVFGPYLPNLPRASATVRANKIHDARRDIRIHSKTTVGEILDLNGDVRPITSSGPMPKTTNKPSGNNVSKFYSRELNLNLVIRDDMMCLLQETIKPRYGNTNKMERRRQPTAFHSASPSTVGGSGLSLRYANVIILAEKLLNTTASMGEDARSLMFEMLPSTLRTKMRLKLKGDRRNNDRDPDLAEGWREAVEGIMRWLAPVAHDTVRWQSDRNLEKQKFDSRPTALLIQTLHFSDLEKTEAAIVEVLVGLSCIYRYENRSPRSCSGDLGGQNEDHR